MIVPLQSLPTIAPSVPATVPEISQLSVQLKLVIAGISSIQSIVTFAGAAANTGEVLSSIIIF